MRSFSCLALPVEAKNFVVRSRLGKLYVSDQEMTVISSYSLFYDLLDSF